MAARMRAERTAAASEQIDARGAVAGAAGALLAVHFLAGAMDVGAVLDRVRAGLPLGQLPNDAAMNDVGARLEPENGIGHRDRAGLLAVEGGDFQFHITPLLASAAAGASAAAAQRPAPYRVSASLNLPGFGTPAGSFFFTASRTVIQPPLTPGTAPRPG